MSTSLAQLVEPNMDAVEADVHQAFVALREADADVGLAAEVAEKAVSRAEELRQIAATRRLEFGRALQRARAGWPERGPKAKGWTDMLERIGIGPDAASDAIAYAKAVMERFSGTDGRVPEKLPTLAEAGIDKRPRASDATDNRPAYGGDRQRETDAPDDRDAPPDNVIPLELDDPEPKAPDRNTWCTPKKWADAIGPVDLDPCSNERSHIQAKATFVLERGENGLALAPEVPDDQLEFINCPYGRGLVIQWVRAYGQKRFIFLLKFDPSTKWFAELIARTTVVMFPKDERMEFEPPPGVESSSVQFPHAFFYAREEDITDEMRALCLPPWRIK